MDGLTTGTVAGIIGVLIWYLRYTTKQNIEREKQQSEVQKEDRDFNRELITGALKDIHSTGLKNAEMNRESIKMQEGFQKESVGVLKIITERLNGGTEGMRAIKKLKEYEKQREKEQKIVSIRK